MLLGIALCSCAQESRSSSTPELIEVSQNQIVVAWQGDIGEIEYWPLGKPDAVSLVSDDAETSTHEVRIRGLTPGTYYSYRIKGADEHYNVQTEPGTSSSVSFILFDNITSDELLRLLISDSPGFLVSLSVLEVSSFREIRPFVQVYDPDGKTAAYLRSQPNFKNKSGYRIQWGSFVLSISKKPDYLQEQIDSLKPGYTLGLLTTSQSAASLDFTPLEKHPIASSTPPCFVLLRDSDETVEKTGVRLVGVNAKPTYFKIVVDTESAFMTEIPSGIQTDLRLAPVSTKRTCAECRKLADKGAFRKSVAAYVAFIEANEKHHLIDDAYFEVANIYDEKLFEFESAITWYEALVKTYPGSSLTPFARERLKFFKGFDKGDRNALQEFEKIRRVSYLAADEQTKDTLIEQVLRKSNEKKTSSLAPVMLYWVGNQLRQKDAARAVAVYQKLVAAYPKHHRAHDAVYAAAETLYDAKDYKGAREAYRKALSQIPERKTSILAQIDRCNRNIRRHFLIWPASIVLFLIILVSLAFRRNCQRKQWIKAGFISAGLSLVLTTWAWTIREQFPNASVLVALALGSSLIAGLSSTLPGPIAAVTFRKKVWRIIFAGSLGVLAALSGLYILIYFTYEHYLKVFDL